MSFCCQGAKDPFSRTCAHLPQGLEQWLAPVRVESSSLPHPGTRGRVGAMAGGDNTTSIVGGNTRWHEAGLGDLGKCGVFCGLRHWTPWYWGCQREVTESKAPGIDSRIKEMITGGQRDREEA